MTQLCAADIDPALLAPAGYQIEGPGSADDGELAGRFWWTVHRDGWSGIECGDDFSTESQALRDALRALLEDEDLDWAARSIRPHARHQFPRSFGALMAAQVPRNLGR